MLTRIHSGALAGHLRLVAATGLTKMAHYREYEEMISSACFEEIAYQIQVNSCSAGVCAISTMELIDVIVSG
jgi:hypothetical protein